MRWTSRLLLLGLLTAHAAPAGAGGEIMEVAKTWDKAPHNAFTDLMRFKGRWLCAFREGEGHVSPNGALRIISSQDGKTWKSEALIASPKADLRDPKIAETPDGRLMVTTAAALHQPAEYGHQSMVWFSSNGSEWGEPVEIGDPNLWMWRVTWHKGVAYSVGYSTVEPRFIRLYSSADGRRFDTLADRIFTEGYPNETSLVFLEDETCLCLLRRDAGSGTAQLGTAKPPYKEWTWKDLGVHLGGPHMLRLPDKRIVAAGRCLEGGSHTSLAWLDPEKGALTEFLKLPSGGDTSYPGLVFHEGLLWVSYYSSHEGKTSIYLAKVKLPAAK